MPVEACVSSSHSPVAPAPLVSGVEVLPYFLTAIGTPGRPHSASKERRSGITGSVTPQPKIAIDWPLPLFVEGASQIDQRSLMLRSPVFGTFPLVASCVVAVHGPVSWTRGIESLLKLFS